MFSQIRIAILGAGGQLGQEFKVLLSQHYPQWEINYFSSHELDITNKDALKELFSNQIFDYVINCAAYTAVDKAESEPEKCYHINTEACQYLADVLQHSVTKLVHFSSDYVYDNDSSTPMDEESPTHPKSVYAKSKLKGELILRNSSIPTLILRTSWVVSSFGHNFVKTILRLAREKSSISVVNDQKGAPTYARHLAHTVCHIIAQTAYKENSLLDFNQTYNYADSGETTWYNIALLILNKISSECQVHPIPTSDYPTPAQRPLYSVMSLEKIKKTYKIEIPRWEIGIDECLKEIRTQI